MAEQQQSDYAHNAGELPVGSFSGSSVRYDLPDDRYVELGYGTSDLCPRCWFIRAGTGESYLQMGLSAEAMEALVDLYVNTLTALASAQAAK